MSCSSFNVQLTIGLLKTGKYTLTKSPYDVGFRDELSGVYVRRMERRGECSLLQVTVMFSVRQACVGAVNMANFVRQCVSWYNTLN